MPTSPPAGITPADVRAIGTTLLQLAKQLDAAASPQDAADAARLLEAVTAPDDGVLNRLADVFAAAARTTQRHAKPRTELWRNLGMAARDLREWGELLEDMDEDLAQFSARPASPAPATAVPPPPTSVAPPGRGR
ncbi:hypothetical protein OK074_4998 [Actinobacteria bacterium OK074]|nr:hypothetical protein OK074_4998 [Actinobacteria bacterium OK074]